MTDQKAYDEMKRSSTAETVRRILAPVMDLHGLAAEANRITRPRPASRALAWTAQRAVSGETLERLIEIADHVTEWKADLTLYIDGDSGPVYLRRWWLHRQQAENGSGGEHGLYVHRFEASDPAALHDHPWPSASLMLSTGVNETSEQGTTTIDPGTVVIRPARFRHRIELHRAADGTPRHALTLIATGRREHGWGFEQDDGTIAEVTGDRNASRRRALTETD